MRKTSTSDSVSCPSPAPTTVTVCGLGLALMLLGLTDDGLPLTLNSELATREVEPADSL